MYGHAYRVGIDKVQTTLKDGGAKNHTLSTHPFPLPHVLFLFFLSIRFTEDALSLGLLQIENSSS